MSTPPDSAPPSTPRNSLANAVDIIIAPNAAFERIRAVPAWGWVFLVATVLGIVGFLLAQPAYMHALSVSGPSLYAKALANVPPEKQASTLATMLSFGRTMIMIQWLFIPIGILIGSLLSAVIMLIANAVSHGDGTFKRFFALAVTTTVVSSLGLLLNGVIVLVRGADSYDTMQSIQTGLPSLALLAPGAGAKLVAFLGVLNVTTLWSTALTALGMTVVGHVKPPIAWTAAILGLLVAAGFAAMFVQ